MAKPSSPDNTPQSEPDTAADKGDYAIPLVRANATMPRSQAVGWLLILVSTLVLVVVMAEWWPLGFDYVTYYRPITERWLNGQTRLYDANSLGLVDGPSILALMIPLTLLSVHLGQAILNVGSLLCILLAVFLVQKHNGPVPLLFIILGIANLHMVGHLFNGQIDAYILLGMTLTWYAALEMRTPSHATRWPWLVSLGLWLMTIKPINVLLVGWMLVAEMRHWTKADILRALSLPLASLVVSLLACGPDWPARYLSNLGFWEGVQSWPPDTPLLSTIWRAASALNVHIAIVTVVCAAAVILALIISSKRRASLATLSLAIATNLCVTPYAYGHHYVLLMPAYLFVASRHRWLALLAWGTMSTPLLRVGSGLSIAWVDVLYPAVLLISTWLMLFESHNDPDKRAQQQSSSSNTTRQ